MFFEYEFGELNLRNQISTNNGLLEFSLLIFDKKNLIPNETAIEIKCNNDVGLITNIFQNKQTGEVLLYRRNWIILL